MAINVRGGGIPLRGSGSSGGGSITVKDHTGEAISTGVRTIEWQTLDQFGFTVTVDPDDETRVIVGVAPEFLDPIQWSSNQTVDVRVSESDPAAGDAFLTDGKEGTILKGSLGNFVYNSTLGRGFGTEASLSVKTYHAGTLVDDFTFNCSANGSSTQGNVTVTISDYAPDGDGSVFQGRLNVNVDSVGVIGNGRSGVCRVEIRFVEQKFGGTQTISQDVFKDSNSGTLEIVGAKYYQESRELDERFLKYLSGIAYYDLNTAYEVSVGGFKSHNKDSSKPTGSIAFNMGTMGINPYTATPFLQPTEFVAYNNKHNLSTFNYYELRAIDRTNFRHVGESKFIVNMSDSWNTSVNYDSNILKLCIDTVNNPSTDSVEYFDAENKRLDSDYTTAWDSQRYCLDGEAIVYGGSLYHGSDLPRILENVAGALGTAGSLTATLPNENVLGNARQNPNYTGFNRSAVFLRRFKATDLDTKANFNVNIKTNGTLLSQLQSGDLKVYVWKEGSTNPTTPNITLPPNYNPTNGALSVTGSIWLHGTNNYNFGTFQDGAQQTNAAATCRTNVVGSLVSATFGGNDCIGGILMRVEVARGVRVDEISVTFI